MQNKWCEFFYLPKNWFLLITILATLILSSILGYLLPGYMADLFSSYEKGGFEHSLFLLLGVFIIEYFNRITYQLCINRYVQKLVHKVRGDVYQKWLLSYEAQGENHDSKDSFPLGEVLSRVMNDTESVRELVTTGSFGIFIDLIFIISCLIGFISLNTVSGIFLISLEIFACIGLLWASRFMVRVFMDVRRSTGNMSRCLADLTSGLSNYYYTPHGSYLMSRAEVKFQDFLSKQLKANVWDASYYSLAESLYPIILAALILVFPYSQIIEMGVLAAIIDLIQRSIAPIKDVTSKVSNIQRARTGVERIQEFYRHLDSFPKSHLIKEYRALDIDRVKIRIPYFRYNNGDFALHNIMLEAHRGELVGIVGFSGSGKSTLLKILSLQILASQSIIDIVDIQKNHYQFRGNSFEQMNQYRAQVSIVSQDSYLFSASLRMNITLGQKESEFDGFWRQISDKIPYLKTWAKVPEDHIEPSSVSLGQKQLISALRACFLCKPIILFDEVSSGMDSELEQSIRLLVLSVQKTALTFIVAHRVETILKANKILVMQDGQVTHQGSHSELMEESDVYSQFISKIVHKS